MRQRIDLADLYRRALRQAKEDDDDSGSPRGLRPMCPYSLDDLLARDPDLTLLIAKLAA